MEAQTPMEEDPALDEDLEDPENLPNESGSSSPKSEGPPSASLAPLPGSSPSNSGSSRAVESAPQESDTALQTIPNQRANLSPEDMETIAAMVASKQVAMQQTSQNELMNHLVAKLFDMGLMPRHTAPDEANLGLDKAETSAEGSIRGKAPATNPWANHEAARQQKELEELRAAHVQLQAEKVQQAKQVEMLKNTLHEAAVESDKQEKALAQSQQNLDVGPEISDPNEQLWVKAVRKFRDDPPLQALQYEDNLAAVLAMTDKLNPSQLKALKTRMEKDEPRKVDVPQLEKPARHALSKIASAALDKLPIYEYEKAGSQDVQFNIVLWVKKVEETIQCGPGSITGLLIDELPELLLLLSKIKDVNHVFTTYRHLSSNGISPNPSEWTWEDFKFHSKKALVREEHQTTNRELLYNHSLPDNRKASDLEPFLVKLERLYSIVNPPPAENEIPQLKSMYSQMQAQDLHARLPKDFRTYLDSQEGVANKLLTYNSLRELCTVKYHFWVTTVSYNSSPPSAQKPRLEVKDKGKGVKIPPKQRNPLQRKMKNEIFIQFRTDHRDKCAMCGEAFHSPTTNEKGVRTKTQCPRPNYKNVMKLFPGKEADDVFEKNA